MLQTKRYVQHLSGQGEPVQVCTPDDATVAQWLTTVEHHWVAYLPKSAYVRCEPPETRTRS